MSSGDESPGTMALRHQQRLMRATQAEIDAAIVRRHDEALAAARADGYRAGLEAAARRVEGPGSGLRDKRLHAHAIRALIEPEGKS